MTGADGGTLVLLEVSIEGRGPFDFALDTGASHTLIHRGLADELGLPQVGRVRGLAGISGNVNAVRVKVSSWSIGETELEATEIVAADVLGHGQKVKFRGLLGSDVLNNFGRIVIDYDQEVLLLDPQQGQPAALGTLGAPRHRGGLVGLAGADPQQQQA